MPASGALSFRGWLGPKLPAEPKAETELSPGASDGAGGGEGGGGGGDGEGLGLGDGLGLGEGLGLGLGLGEGEGDGDGESEGVGAAGTAALIPETLPGWALAPSTGQLSTATEAVTARAAEAGHLRRTT